MSLIRSVLNCVQGDVNKSAAVKLVAPWNNVAVGTPVHRLDLERCYKLWIFFYQNVGAVLFYIVYRYIKILFSEFNLVYFSASFREKSELESLPLRFYTIGIYSIFPGLADVPGWLGLISILGQADLCLHKLNSLQSFKASCTIYKDHVDVLF